MSTVCLVIAIVLFVLAGFNVEFGNADGSPIGLGWIGLAFFAAAHLPLGDWLPRR